MGCGASSPAKASGRQPDTNVASSYPEDGKKLRLDATLEEEYELGDVLGEGGFSKVRLATHRASGEQYACKIIPLPKPGNRVNENMSDRAAILKEIDVLLDLDHPNVVCLREYFVERNKVYLIMELLRGGELLEAVLEQGHYSENDARTIFRQLIKCLQYLHAKGVVHRDVKLDNLLLVEPRDIKHIKIADFGFAKKVSGGRLEMKTVCGTPEYIAPEVIEKLMGPQEKQLKDTYYGPPCDLWSAGIVLYMLLAGLPPFYDASEPRLLRAIMKGQYSFSDPVWEEVSAPAKDLIQKLLVVSPTKRLTCEQVLEHPWMSGASSHGSERQLTRTRSRMLEKLEKKRSGGQASLQQRISQAACSSAAATPAGGSPAGGSPTIAGCRQVTAAAWSTPAPEGGSPVAAAAGSPVTGPAGGSPPGPAAGRHMAVQEGGLAGGGVEDSVGGSGGAVAVEPAAAAAAAAGGGAAGGGPPAAS